LNHDDDDDDDDDGVCWLMQQAARVKTEAQSSSTDKASGRGNVAGGRPGRRQRMSPEEIDVENSITHLLMQQRRSKPGRRRGRSLPSLLQHDACLENREIPRILQRIRWKSGKFHGIANIVFNMPCNTDV